MKKVKSMRLYALGMFALRERLVFLITGIDSPEDKNFIRDSRIKGDARL